MGDEPEISVEDLAKLSDVDPELMRMKLARLIVESHGLPKGPVERLLEEEGVDPAIIEQIATKLVPYRYT